MVKKNLKNTQSGFTLVEVMIAVAIFTIVVTIGIGAVLDAINQHRNTSSTRTVMDSLTFMMEDMSRNIRLGSNVRCLPSGGSGVDYDATSGAVFPQDCATGGNKILLNDLHGNHLIYGISSSGAVYKQVGDVATTAQIISPPEVSMDTTLSGFIVRGSAKSTSSVSDNSQPTVLMHISGTVTVKSVATKFALQTTIALRALDS